MLPNLNDIFTKKVKQFRGQTKNFDMSFYQPRILNNSLIIPEYQRGDVWILEQKEDLIRSMYYGVSIPPIILNQRETKKE